MLQAHEIDDILERFRDWLGATSEDLRATDVWELAERLAEGAIEPSADGGVGLLQVVETMTALRHDLKLQSKDVRALRETTEAALEGLHRATEQVERGQQDAATAAERATRPFVERLLTLDELIGQAADSIERVASQPQEPIAAGLNRELETAYASMPKWKRLAASAWHREVRERIGRYQPEQASSGIKELLDGIRMLRSRAAAALADVGLERVECVGRPVDPTRMRVIEVVDADGSPPETVVEEVRPGYLYQGSVVRCAEVRATRANS